jgi:hypothetical protein
VQSPTYPGIRISYIAEHSLLTTALLIKLSGAMAIIASFHNFTVLPFDYFYPLSGFPTHFLSVSVNQKRLHCSPHSFVVRNQHARGFAAAIART